MAKILYGGGVEYGDAGADYGRLGGDLIAAQGTFVRETGLKVTVIDERVNRWEQVVSDATSLKIDEVHYIGSDPSSPSYYSYRTQAKAIILDNGTVIRVRIGKQTGGVTDPDDRQIYIQTITDLTNVSQWETWTLHYTGVNYAVELVQTGATTYDIYHSKQNQGIFKNNSLLWATGDDGVNLEQCIFISAVAAPWSALYGSTPYYKIVNFGVVRGGADNLRYINYYFTNNIDIDRPGPIFTNYYWYRHLISTTLMDDGKFLIIETMPITDPRSPNRTDSITCRIQTYPNPDNVVPPLVIRGFGSDYGFNTISGARVHKLSDGYYYIFYREDHEGDAGETVSSTQLFVWQRSKDGLHWSEPVHCGFLPNERAGAFEATVGGEDWVYYCGNGDVHRRPASPVEYPIENFVPAISWESPRDNQEGSGEVTVANPLGVNDYLVGLSDRRIRIEPGIKVNATDYEYAQLDDTWIKSVVQSTEGSADRLKLTLGNVWSRLENPLRDTVNIIGQTKFSDWAEGKENQPFNYYFTDGEPKVVNNSLQVVGGGVCLWTGWKGINPQFDFTMDAWDVEIMLRYVDEDNYIKFTYDEPSAGRVIITQVRAGVSTVLTNFTLTKLSTNGYQKKWRVEMKWDTMSFFTYKSGVKFGSGNYTFNSGDTVKYLLKPGYVGWNKGSDYTIANFNFSDLERPMYTGDIVKMALAMGDYHDVVVPQGSEQFAMIWGPQTDLQTPAQALRNALEAEKYELVWRDGQIQVGQFTDVAPVKTITDRIIRTDYVDEANRRINFATVDGNENSWTEVDSVDSQQRDRQIVAYFDLPELKTADAVKARAIEELRRSKLGASPGGDVPLFFDLWRMDPIIWIDNQGRTYNVRVEGISVEINQSTEPFQRSTLDTSLL